MAQQRVRLVAADGGPLAAAFAAARAAADLPDGFAADVLAEAERSAAAPDDAGLPDLTDLPFFTIDPPGSMDLDQAIHLSRGPAGGHRLRYAIADVPAFVPAGGAVDAEARRRAETVYCPDTRVPLHPPVLSEGAASLLPGQVRPAFVWQLDLDATGATAAASVTRALVRSVDRLDDAAVQATVDAAGPEGRLDERFTMLREVGQRRLALEAARGGISLQLPEQEVVAGGDGGYALRVRPPSGVADWNAQLSLATGMAAAAMMLQAGVGLLRTLPAPDPGALDRFRLQASTLGVPWPDGATAAIVLRGLDRTDPRQLALLHAATGLFRGAGYTAFDGTPPEEPAHAAVGAPYAHVTAPLRRLVDRFGLALCAALSAGQPVPGWVREALPALPAAMATGDRRAAQVERACTDAVEAAVLHGRAGETFDGVVVERRGHGEHPGVVVQLTDPPVVSRVEADLPPGSTVRLRLVGTDVAAGRVDLQPV